MPTLTHSKQKGFLLSLLAIPVGIILWDIIWSWGFIASIVSFAIAWSAVKLFTVGSGTEPSKKDLYVLLSVIIVAVVLSFLSGMVLDAQSVYSETTHVGMFDSFASADFWSYLFSNLADGSVWSAYAGDIAMALVFAVLGLFVFVRDLFMGTKKTQTTIKKK